MNNPFITIGNIPEVYFCDRKEETEKIVKWLTDGTNVCLMSQRRMGKSKLVKHCYEQPAIGDNYYTFYIDILHTTSLRELTYAFGSAVFDVLRSRSERMLVSFVQGLKSISAKFGFDAFSGMPTFSLELGDIAQPEYTLSEILACLEQADKPCIVAFDEFQQIGQYGDGKVEALLRAHIQHLQNVRFLFSGSERHLISEMFLSAARPFYNSTSMLELQPIRQEVYADFVCGWMERSDRHIEPHLVDRVYEVFGGNTYYMQKTFHELFANSEAGHTITLPSLAATLEGILEEASVGYRIALSRMTEKQKELLYAIADAGQATGITSARFIKQYALASASSVQAAAKKLLEYDQVQCLNSIYTVADPLFRLYLLRLRDSRKALI